MVAMVQNGRLLTCARVLGIALGVQIAVAQQKCYYPNGNDAADSEKPCSSAEGSACCPEKWECLDNGMCYYPPDKIYGRYSCTDKNWEADGCPSNLCTYDKTAFGAENMQQCSGHNNQWCCNADNVHVDCCNEKPEPRPFFDLKDGTAYATVGGNSPDQVPVLATITGLASGSGGGNSPSATGSAQSSIQSEPSSASKEGSPAPTGPTTPVTSLSTLVSSGSAGIVTQVITSIITPSASGTGSANPVPSSSNSKLPLIVGLAVGIPLALALAGIIIWLLRKRSHQKKQTSFPESPNPYTNGALTPDFAGGAKLHKHSGSTGEYESKADVPELAGQSVGPARPVSSIQGKAELDSGHGFAPGAVAHAPHLVGVGGGSGHTPQASSWGSAPPGYSPGQNTNAWAPAGAGLPPGVVEADDTAVRPNTGGSAGAAAVPTAGATTEGGRYIPYRPPQGHGQTGLQNVTGAAEMNAVTTPPAAELSTVRTPPAAELSTVRTPPA